MIKKINLLLILISIITINLKAQTVPSPSESYLGLEVLNPALIPDEVLDTLTNPMNLLTANDSLKISVSMLLEDTMVLSKIHIKLGTTLGGNDLLDQTFLYDNSNLTLPQGYFREKEMVTIVLGEYPYTGVFYNEIVLEDVDGNQSGVLSCQSDQ